MKRSSAYAETGRHAGPMQATDFVMTLAALISSILAQSFQPGWRTDGDVFGAIITGTANWSQRALSRT
ncbi:hypothetical protein QN219_28430 [Sinorhizobium sp. 7-81]|uniref:hypothetical protein n=1 Tax=Sinorhizobium sp. 8-89 TaxID=3049089 RepID=UPI0024C36B2F|nr:hypothetical protein [Sinorhizobium sp. 8-89]MDK1493918.1 hypothetical protein [Sinorhizobium sp. 8-89]